MTYSKRERSHKSRALAFLADARVRPKIRHEDARRGTKAGQSGQCRAGRHSRCAAINCTCRCGHGVGA